MPRIDNRVCEYQAFIPRLGRHICFLNFAGRKVGRRKCNYGGKDREDINSQENENLPQLIEVMNAECGPFDIAYEIAKRIEPNDSPPNEMEMVAA